MAENYKHLYEQMKKMVVMYQDEIVPGLRTALDKKQEIISELRENFIDYVCSGTGNAAPYCANRCPECVTQRGWCNQGTCKGFNPLLEPPAKEIKCHNCKGTDEPEHYQNKKYCPNCGTRVD